MDSIMHNGQIKAPYAEQPFEGPAPRAAAKYMADMLGAEIDTKHNSVYAFENVGFKDVLQRTSGTLRAGRMAAIMGPSGAGKTTLLKAISGRKKMSEGVLRVNGRPVSPDKVRKLSAFVYQENHLISTLTVHEMLMYTIRVKSRHEKSPEELADSLLETLGLSHVRDSYIGDPAEGLGGISGGEMKRLSIALELVSMPCMVFLDEPTSGLDSGISESVILHLRKLADRGMVVVMTIHQPSSEIFHMFDDLLLLRGGELVYSGPVMGCVGYLKAFGLECPEYTNPADYMFRVINRLPPAARTHVQGGQRYPNEEVCIFSRKMRERQSERGKGVLWSLSEFLYETKVLMQRNTVCGLRNKRYILAKFCQSFLVAAVTGIFFYNVPSKEAGVQITNTVGCYWAICLGVFGAFAYGAITVLFADRNILIKEYTSNYYSFSSYYVAKVLTDFLTTCIHPLLVVPFVFFMARIGSAVHVLACVALGAVGHSLGLFVASTMESADTTLAIFPGVMYPINMLTGRSVDPTSLPRIVSFLQYLSPTRHAYNIMLKTTFPKATPDAEINRVRNSLCSRLASFSILLLMYAVIITLSALCLKHKIKKKSV